MRPFDLLGASKALQRYRSRFHSPAWKAQALGGDAFADAAAMRSTMNDIRPLPPVPAPKFTLKALVSARSAT
jgi:hypothetical protein